MPSKFLLSFLLLALFPLSCRAQQQEQIQFNAWFYGIPCPYVRPPASQPANVIADGRLAGQKTFFLENYVDGVLPDPVYIVQSGIWAESIFELDSTTVGQVGIAIDPQMQYINASNWPIGQFTLNHYTKTLGILEMYPNNKRLQMSTPTLPIAYHSGDALILAPECTGGGTVNIVALFMLQATSDFAAPAYAMNVPLTQADINGPPYSARILVAGPIAAASKIRAHFFMPYSIGGAVNTQSSILSHVSACLQSATTPSSCASAPVEMKCGAQSGIAVPPSFDIWCDWTNLPVPAGQNVLVTVSRFSGATASWAYATSGALWEWGSTGDSWNTVDMQGTITPHQGWTVAVDKVQMR
jgi:hypothetical protein